MFNAFDVLLIHQVKFQFTQVAYEWIKNWIIIVDSWFTLVHLYSR